MAPGAGPNSQQNQARTEDQQTEAVDQPLKSTSARPPADQPAQSAPTPRAPDQPAKSPAAGEAEERFDDSNFVDDYTRKLDEIDTRMSQAREQIYSKSEAERSQAEALYRAVSIERCVFRRPAALLLPEVCTQDPFDPSCSAAVEIREVTADECRKFIDRYDELDALTKAAIARRNDAETAAEQDAAQEELTKLNRLSCYLSPPISMHREMTKECISNPLHPSCVDDRPRSRCETAMDRANKLAVRVREAWNRRSGRR